MPTPGVPAGHATHVFTDDAPTAVEYVPALQSTHVSDDPLVHDPASQLVHDVEPANAENVPAPQLLHALDDDAATFDEYDPEPHSTHTSDDAAPMLDEYVPAPQPRHTCLLLEPKLLEYVPAAHKTQPVDPLPTAYVPVPHVLHVSAIAPDHEPAPHRAHPVEPAVDHAPALQPPQTLLPAPTAVENMPASHNVHVADDDAPTLTE